MKHKKSKKGTREFPAVFVGLDSEQRKHADGSNSPKVGGPAGSKDAFASKAKSQVKL